jgi:hypothetical protein
MSGTGYNVTYLPWVRRREDVRGRAVHRANLVPEHQVAGRPGVLHLWCRRRRRDRFRSLACAV